MACSGCQCRHAQVPSNLQGLPLVEQAVALQGPCQDHLGPLRRGELDRQRGFGIRFIAEREHVHSRRGRLNCACVAHDLNVFVHGLILELRLCRCPVRISRQRKCS